MILHLVTDEKFTDYAIKQFSSPEMESEFVLIPSNFLKGESEVKLIDEVKVVYPNSVEFQTLLSNLGAYRSIILHGLFWPWCAAVLKAVPDYVKVAWMFWGGEIYSRKELHPSLLAPITRALCNIHKVIKKENDAWQLPIELFQRIEYCLTDINEEYNFAKQYVHSDHLKHLWYNYYSLEETIGEIIDKRCCGNNLWFCNSAASANNAFDAMFKLQRPKNKKRLKTGKIIMPISYGEVWIKNLIVKYGPKLLGKNFCPLKDYMPREEYNALMLSCSAMILPYYYPAGQGNIITALWLGMRVYLSEHSMAFNFFKRIGCVIFSFESEFKQYGCINLSNEDIDINRQILRKMYGKDAMMQSVKNVVDALK